MKPLLRNHRNDFVAELKKRSERPVLLEALDTSMQEDSMTAIATALEDENSI